MAAEPKKNTPANTTDWQQAIEGHRASIDALDNEIVALLKKRLTFVKEIGKIKHTHDNDQYVIRPAREAKMARLVVEAFKDSEFNPIAAVSIWRQIIAASTSTESPLKISVFDAPDQSQHFWTAREYFGTFSPIQKHASVRRVVGDVMDGKANVGILPLIQMDEPDPWWPLLLNDSKDTPRIFAYLPCIAQNEAESERIGGIAIGKIRSEESGNDLTFVTLKTDLDTSQSKLSMLLQKCEIKARWMSVKALADNRLHLIELDGFYTKNHKSLEKLLSEAGSSIVDCTIIGTYAKPIILT